MSAIGLAVALPAILAIIIAIGTLRLASDGKEPESIAGIIILSAFLLGWGFLSHAVDDELSRYCPQITHEMGNDL